jgi:hypothetical protein
VSAFLLAQDNERVKETGKIQTAVKVEKPEPKFFKLEFVLREVDGSKVVNARSYTIPAGTDGLPSSIRTGVKVNVGDAQHPDWTDIGVRIDVRSLRELQNQLACNVTAEITGLPQDTISGTSARSVMRQYVWSSDTVIPMRKPTVIFSSDSTTSRNQMQVEVTATPVP